MARMQTNNVLYFPFDVDYFEDRKIRRLRRECSDKGILIHQHLMCSIYSDKNGYYTRLDENLIFDIAEKEKISEKEFRRIFDVILNTGLFDKEVYRIYSVVTSGSLQKRFQEIVRKKARKTPVRVDERYWLLDSHETQDFIHVVCMDSSVKNDSSSAKKSNSSAKKGNSSAKKGNSSPKNATNKIKENKIKENKIKEEERKKNEESATAAALIAEYEKYIGKASENVCRGISGFLEAGMEPGLVSRLIQYAVERNKCSWQYISAAAEGNIAEGIMTLEKYNIAVKKRKKKPKVVKKGINNYTDTNKPDYSDFSQQILEDMLREADEKEQRRKKEERCEKDA